MGCSASRLNTHLSKAIEDPSSSSISSITTSSSSTSSSSSAKSPAIPKSRSLSTPLVHHPAIRKGDSNHLVCLTSTTYGALVVVYKHPSPAAGDDDVVEFSVESSPDSVINTWELMEGLELSCTETGTGTGTGTENNNFPKFQGRFGCRADPKYQNGDVSGNDNCLKFPCIIRLEGEGEDDLNADSGNGFKLSSLNSSYFDDALKKPSLSLGFNLSNSAKKLSDSYVFVEMPREIVEGGELNLASNSKPLWKHLSEESLLKKMEHNVAAERELLERKMGCDQPRRMSKSLGSIPLGTKTKSVDYSPIFSEFPSDKIMLYFTSLRGIRRTYEDCCSVRMILRGFRVMVDERDISMDSNYRKELQRALSGKVVSLPQLFIRGKHIGGADLIKELHETGELERLLVGFPVQEIGLACVRCGESRFVPCSNCNGSRKVFQEEEGRTRRCPDCNENGLVRCPGCCP